MRKIFQESLERVERLFLSQSCRVVIEIETNYVSKFK